MSDTGLPTSSLEQNPQHAPQRLCSAPEQLVAADEGRNVLGTHVQLAHAPDGDAGGDAASLPGARWLALALALADAATPALPAAQALRRMLEAVHASGDPAALRQQTRLLLHYHCGVAALSTRRVMMELHNL